MVHTFGGGPLVKSNQAKKTTVFHVTHWKAGSQWIHKILREIALERIVPPQLDEKQFLAAPLVCGAIYPTVYVTKEQFYSVVLPANYRKFIIIRDLRDTLISGYFSIRYSHAVIDQRLARWRERLEVMTVEQGLLMLLDEWLPFSGRIQESWLEADEACIRYEDLLAQDSEILETVLIDHCELPVTRERLREIVVANRFEKLTDGRKPGEENWMAHERKGIAGDWENYFTSAVTEEFNKRYGRLVVAYGAAGNGNRMARLQRHVIPRPQTRVMAMRVCWCGNADLTPFNPEYSECKACGTLVSLAGLSADELLVTDDETDFYGKQYWLDHQSEDLGYPDIHKRARIDLTERNLHWLKTLVKYRLPPAKVLELGCSHGSFVALLRQAGFDASGVEMSPWVIEFGQKTFGVPIARGPVETLDLAPGSIEVIVLMDVLEHLPDPVATMAHCLQLLQPDGLLLIQTPQFSEGMDFTKLVEEKGAFLDVLKADEHLYLFTDHSVTRLFKELGAKHIQFETAIFGYYDMFFAVSRTPLQENSTDQIEKTLLATPNGRMAMALLDLRANELSLTAMLQESEADRAARGEQIASLTGMLRESEADREALNNTLGSLIRDLEQLFARPGFSKMAGIFGWNEVTHLQDRIKVSND